jgi:GNAT acetyltransferase-like protein
MTEALQLMLRYAFKKIKLHRLEANIQPGNVASISLVRRAGFRREGYSPRYLKICGRWRDHERWAIAVEDWRSLKKIHLRFTSYLRCATGDSYTRRIETRNFYFRSDTIESISACYTNLYFRTVLALTDSSSVNFPME